MANKKCKNCGKLISGSSHYCTAKSETVVHDYTSDIFMASLILSSFNTDYGSSSTDFGSSSDYGSSSPQDFGGGDFGGGGGGGDW